MMPPSEPLFRRFNLALLRGASALVPRSQRADWLREWHAELWHVRHVCAPGDGISWGSEREIAVFCLGAFQDALCLRQQALPSHREPHASRPSPERCILHLAAILAASLLAALLLPGVGAVRSLSPPQVNPGLVLIYDADARNKLEPTITPAQYQMWKSRRQRYFDGFAFYRVTQETVETDLGSSNFHEKARWEIGRASLNLFLLLGAPVRFENPAEGVGGDLPQVILSETMWKRDFGADPHVAGRVLRLGSRKARVVGVAPDGSWGLPGRIGAWMLQPDAEASSDGLGYVVAHLTPVGASAMWAGCVRITAYGPNDVEDDLLGISLGAGTPSPWGAFLFTVILALLALPATTSVSLGEYAVCSHKPSWPRRLYRAGFFGAKVALLLPSAYFVSLDLAYGRTAFDSTTAVYIQLVSSFFICLFGLNWALRDQRQRCPVCLRRVAHPAQVGQASRTFLAWNGTELMCTGGHTLLHVPGLPTSWFSTQRWMYLDSSWSFLFADSGPGIKKELITGFPAH